jgi:quercetin dioxygenase-like cupin family protein
MQITHHFGGGVYVKETHFSAGEFGEKHVHDFDHLSTLVYGTVRLFVDGRARTIAGPAVLTIEAGKTHEVHALTDVIWHCTHATDCTDPDMVDSALTEGA